MAGQIDVRRTGKRWYVFGSGFAGIRKGAAFFVDALGRAISINNPAPVFDTRAAAEAVARAFAPGHGVRLDNPTEGHGRLSDQYTDLVLVTDYATFGGIGFVGDVWLKNGRPWIRYWGKWGEGEGELNDAMREKIRAMIGRKNVFSILRDEHDIFTPWRGKNSVPRGKIASAKALYESFRDQPAGDTLDIEQPDFSTGLVIGRLSAVEYDTVRAGKREDYRHVFGKRSQPLLCVTADGKTLFTVQGAFQFTERGIVDK